MMSSVDILYSVLSLAIIVVSVFMVIVLIRMYLVLTTLHLLIERVELSFLRINRVPVQLLASTLGALSSLFVNRKKKGVSAV